MRRAATALALAAMLGCGRAPTGGQSSGAPSSSAIPPPPPERPYELLSSDAGPSLPVELLGVWERPSPEAEAAGRDYDAKIARATQKKERETLAGERAVGLARLQYRLTITRHTMMLERGDETRWLTGYEIEAERGRTLTVRLTSAGAPLARASFTLGSEESMSSPELAPLLGGDRLTRVGQR